MSLEELNRLLKWIMDCKMNQMEKMKVTISLTTPSVNKNGLQSWEKQMKGLMKSFLDVKN